MIAENYVNTSDPSLVRDVTNHALLNTNSEAYRLYKQNRQSQESVSAMNTRVESLEQSVREMQHSLDKIIDLLVKK